MKTAYSFTNDTLFSIPKDWAALFDGNELWTPLVSLESFLHSSLLGRIDVDLSPGVWLKKKELISIGEGTLVDPGVYIEGPCFIGKNCQIRHGSYIRGGALIGDGAVVGHATEVKHSILFPNAKAAHFAYVGDSILGAVSLGAGVKCANLRFDRGEISIRIGGKKIPTGLKKLGSILGDGVQIGCNAVLNPGTIMGRGAVCYPCINTGGEILEGMVAPMLGRRR